jgi:4-hydroxybenzoate polyprenyltransferase
LFGTEHQIHAARAWLVNDPSSFPLVVDLDGTLSRTDSLAEALVAVMLRHPREMPAILAALASGRLALKEMLTRTGHVRGETLPMREDFLEFLRAEHARGRELHLATGSTQAVADAVAERVGLFTSANGSGNGINLTGRDKLALLQKKFPGGFAYAGNDRKDLAVWRDAKAIILVGASPSTRRAAERLGPPVEGVFAPEQVAFGDWLKAIRLHQWAKNLLLFVPLLLAHKYLDWSALRVVLNGFVAFGCVASGTYLINDLSDLEADRAHPTKRNRLIARGGLSAPAALLTALTMIAGGLIGSALIGLPFLGLLVLYIATTLSYSLHLKAVPMLDVFVLGALYTLRIFMGMVLIQATPSPWLLAFAMFFFFSLSMAKRHVEIVRAPAGTANGDVSHELIKGRGYRASDAPLTLTFGIASGLAAILILFLYIVNDAYPVGAYKHPAWLWMAGFLIFLWFSRVWLLSHRGELDDDPVLFAVRDPASLAIGALIVGVFTLAIL